MYKFKSKLLATLSVFLILSSSVFAAEDRAENTAAENTYVIGHLNPDADSIAGAIAAAYLFGAKAARTGKINQESVFLLKYFGVKAWPRRITKFTGEEKIIAVDFNQKSQAPKDIDKAEIVRIIDHHALQENPLTSKLPIEVEIKPWGSVCTIIAHIFMKEEREIPRHIAGMLLGAIISDTLNLRSETTTDHDRNMVKLLAKQVNIKDIDGFAREMFLAKSDVSKKSDSEILNDDFKMFEIGGKTIGIGVFETLTPDQIIARKDGIIEAALQKKVDDNIDLLFFFVVDTENIKSQLLIAADKEQELAEAVFGASTQDSIVDTGSLVSRKLHFVPMLTKYLESK